MGGRERDDAERRRATRHTEAGGHEQEHTKLGVGDDSAHAADRRARSERKPRRRFRNDESGTGRLEELTVEAAVVGTDLDENLRLRSEEPFDQNCLSRERCWLADRAPPLCERARRRLDLALRLVPATGRE